MYRTLFYMLNAHTTKTTYNSCEEKPVQLVISKSVSIEY